MWKPFEPGSSPVDWCERNYSISSSIAEFMNTLSNLVFLLLPPILMHLFRDYGRFVNPGIHVIWFLLMIVGLSSAYFHATLSLIGQLLDELAILWVYMAGFCMFFPRRYFPNILHNDRKLLSICAMLPTLIATGLSFIHPAINAFALMSLGIPAFGFMIVELKRMRNHINHRC
ncbi:alkaline ceramidase isoform X2 [Megalopta genalis]|uniref:alkaline ceramidase isoform X2 n=1 Tax=Megalopta genalis TaxID=115081 RepID=UPI00144380A2|nr:alkaline ceramidase isoform X2 [Megalopta genalis]